MMAFIIGVVAGAVLAVAVPAVYKFVSKQYASAKKRTNR